MNNLKNDELISKWHSIKSNQYTQFKLEVLDRTGDHVEIEQCKIFGVKM